MWMHYKDTNEVQREKAWWELHKNATSYFEKILEATPHETTAVRPLTFHLKNYPNKMNNRYCSLLEKPEQSHVMVLYEPQHMNISVLADQQELIYVRTKDIVWKTGREWCSKGTDGERERERERESGKSVFFL